MSFNEFAERIISGGNNYGKVIGRCEKCNGKRYEECTGLGCIHMHICEDCISNGDEEFCVQNSLYYGYCLYCVLSGQEIFPDWANYDSVVGQVMGAFDIGYNDGYTNKCVQYRGDRCLYDNLLELYEKGVTAGKNAKLLENMTHPV